MNPSTSSSTGSLGEPGEVSARFESLTPKNRAAIALPPGTEVPRHLVRSPQLSPLLPTHNARHGTDLANSFSDSSLLLSTKSPKTEFATSRPSANRSGGKVVTQHRVHHRQRGTIRNNEDPFGFEQAERRLALQRRSTNTTATTQTQPKTDNIASGAATIKHALKPATKINTQRNARGKENIDPHDPTIFEDAESDRESHGTAQSPPQSIRPEQLSSPLLPVGCSKADPELIADECTDDDENKLSLLSPPDSKQKRRQPETPRVPDLRKVRWRPEKDASRRQKDVASRNISECSGDEMEQEALVKRKRRPGETYMKPRAGRRGRGRGRAASPKSADGDDESVADEDFETPEEKIRKYFEDVDRYELKFG